VSRAGAPAYHVAAEQGNGELGRDLDEANDKGKVRDDVGKEYHIHQEAEQDPGVELGRRLLKVKVRRQTVATQHGESEWLDAMARLGVRLAARLDLGARAARWRRRRGGGGGRRSRCGSERVACTGAELDVEAREELRVGLLGEQQTEAEVVGSAPEQKVEDEEQLRQWQQHENDVPCHDQQLRRAVRSVSSRRGRRWRRSRAASVRATDLNESRQRGVLEATRRPEAHGSWCIGHREACAPTVIAVSPITRR